VNLWHYLKQKSCFFGRLKLRMVCNKFISRNFSRCLTVYFNISCLKTCSITISLGFCSRFWRSRFLPAHALDYGIFGATSSEYLAAMGWSKINISWLWFSSLLIFPWLQRHSDNPSLAKTTVILTALVALFIWFSAEFFRFRFGYAVIFLFIALWAILTDALARLRVMQGDRFLLATAIGLVVLVVGFIFYPISKLFTIFFSGEEGDWHTVTELLGHSALWKVVGNSLAVSASVGLFSVIFALIFALYTTRIAKRSLFVSKVFALLPMGTPPFVVSLGVMLMFGRSGYVTQFFVQHFGINTNWLYGFNGILISHTLARHAHGFYAH